MYRPETRSQDQQRYDPDSRGRSEDDYTSRDVSRSGQSGTSEQGDWNQRRSRGNWTGYVVPYRYYGNGYAGVGYYSVMYQGSPEGDDEGRGQFDQRDVDYGQGQGSGAAWTGQRSTGRSTMGGQAGRGPKGYKRSDQRLQEDISDRLMADDWTDASDIEVQVKNAEVTLTGTVHDRQAKRRAEDIAEQVMGVKDVMNQIRVESESSSERSSYGRESGTRSTSSSGRSTRNGGRSSDQQSKSTTSTTSATR